MGGGATTQPDDDIRENFGAIEAKNMEFGPGWCESRLGFGQAWNPAAAVLGMYNWINQANANRLLYLAGGKLISRDLGSGTELDIVTGVGAASGFTAAPYGSRVILAFHGSAGQGIVAAKVWNGDLISGVPAVDDCFQGPLTTAQVGLASAQVAVLPEEQPLTAGIHNAAIVIETRNGHQTGLSPSTGGLVVPLSITASGTHAYTITATPVGAWPAWVAKVWVVLTTTSNTARYFFVQTTEPALVLGGTSTPVVLRVGISDTALAVADNSQEVLNIQNKVTTADSLLPFAVEVGVNRVAYLTQVNDLTLNIQSGVFVSNQDDPQYITWDQHLIQLPGFKRVSCIRWQGRSLYMFGPNWTYLQSDTGGFPVEWPTAEGLDDKIGTRWIGGVSVNAGGYMLVAHESGLYRFSGNAYDKVPLSWIQGKKEWESINWAAGVEQLVVKEDPTRNRILVKAPINGSGTANAILCWDYANGMTPDKVRFSWWTVEGTGGPSIGGMEMVMHPSTQKGELWIGRPVAGPVLRQKNPNYIPDQGSLREDHGPNGIDAQYITPIAEFSDSPLDWVAVQVSLVGSGLAKLWLRAHKAARMVGLADANMATQDTFLRWGRMQSQSAALKVTNGAVAGSWFRLTRAKFWFKNWVAKVGG